MRRAAGFQRVFCGTGGNEIHMSVLESWLFCRGPVLSACSKEPTKHTGGLLGLFPWLGVLLYPCVPLATVACVLLLLKARMN